MDWFKVYAKICFLLPMVFKVFTIKYLSWFPADVPVIQWDHGSPGSFRAKIFKGHRSRWPCRSALLAGLWKHGMALVGWTVGCQTQIRNGMVRINKSTKILSIRRISNRKICTCDSWCITDIIIHILSFSTVALSCPVSHVSPQFRRAFGPAAGKRHDATRRRKMLRNLWKNKPQAINIWDSYD